MSTSKKLKGTTQSGFSWEISPETLNDMELLDLFSELSENPLLLPKVVVKVLGVSQRKALYDHVRAEDGRVPIDALEAEFTEILQGSEPVKN